MLRLPLFLEHYRLLGVDAFFFVVNSSTDGTEHYLLDQPDTYVFKTDESYKSNKSGIRWTQALTREYGLGKWCIFVDADEFLTYPNETLTVKQLCSFLETERASGIGTMLLDMYADGFPIFKNDKQLSETFPYFDKFPSIYYLPYETQAGKSAMVGGVRRRVFNMNVNLNKFALIRASLANDFSPGMHFVSNVDLSAVSGALFHYKYDSEFPTRVQEEAAREQHWNNSEEYKTYAKAFEAYSGLSLFHPDYSVRYINNSQLIDVSIMRSTVEFDQYASNALGH